MALSKEAYQALEDIVGPENISQESATLDSYNWSQSNYERAPDRSGLGSDVNSGHQTFHAASNPA